jgi:hypothetical protein
MEEGLFSQQAVTSNMKIIQIFNKLVHRLNDPFIHQSEASPNAKAYGNDGMQALPSQQQNIYY